MADSLLDSNLGLGLGQVPSPPAHPSSPPRHHHLRERHHSPARRLNPHHHHPHHPHHHQLLEPPPDVPLPPDTDLAATLMFGPVLSPCDVLGGESDCGYNGERAAGGASASAGGAGGDGGGDRGGDKGGDKGGAAEQGSGAGAPTGPDEAAIQMATSAPLRGHREDDAAPLLGTAPELSAPGPPPACPADPDFATATATVSNATAISSSQRPEQPTLMVANVSCEGTSSSAASGSGGGLAAIGSGSTSISGRSGNSTGHCLIVRPPMPPADAVLPVVDELVQLVGQQLLQPEQPEPAVAAAAAAAGGTPYQLLQPAGSSGMSSVEERVAEEERYMEGDGEDGEGQQLRAALLGSGGGSRSGSRSRNGSISGRGSSSSGQSGSEEDDRFSGLSGARSGGTAESAETPEAAAAVAPEAALEAVAPSVAASAAGGGHHVSVGGEVEGERAAASPGPSSNDELSSLLERRPVQPATTGRGPKGAATAAAEAAAAAAATSSVELEERRSYVAAPEPAGDVAFGAAAAAEAAVAGDMSTGISADDMGKDARGDSELCGGSEVVFEAPAAASGYQLLPGTPR